jgi:hypothetical protein
VQVRFSYYGSQSLPDQNVQISPKSSLAALIGEEDSIISLFGGDMTFECGFVGTGLSEIGERLTVKWNVTGRGADRGAQVRYGYNMTNIDHTKDDSETFNAVVPYWDDGSGTKTYVSGYIVQPTTPITPVKAVPMDCTQAFSTQPTGAQLTQYAQDWLDANMPWLGTETLTVDFVNGIEFDPHSPQFDLGDTVHVYWGDAKVAAELRIVEYEFDVLSESFTKLKLGKQQENFVSVTGIDGGSGGDGTIKTENPTVIDKSTTTTGLTADTTYTVSGDGVIVVFAGIVSDDTNDYGTFQSRIYYDGSLVMGEGTRWANALALEIGASTAVPIAVTNGKKIRVYLRHTKNGTKYVCRRFLCFGCTVT